MNIYRICKVTEEGTFEALFENAWEAEAHDTKSAAQQYVDEFHDNLADDVSEDGEEIELCVMRIEREIVTLRASVEKKLEIA